QQRNIQFNVQDLPSLSIEGDEAWLQLAISNLIENALKYSPDNSVVSISLESSQNDTVCLSITDEGPGIPEDELPQVTERHYRGTQSHFRPGSGLGLSIVHWVLEQHKGTIRFRNNVQRGLTVTITLPVSQG
ncbi:MAG: sensor histidine kinase, partial [Fidelibacterota bacterium]